MANVVPQTLRQRVNRAAVAVVLGLTACDPYVNVTGVVRDSSGAPLPDVAVILTMPGRVPDKATTGSDGSYDVGIVGADSTRSRISFERVGCKSIEQIVGQSEQLTLDVTLVRE